jgi:hypothetical protein
MKQTLESIQAEMAELEKEVKFLEAQNKLRDLRSRQRTLKRRLHWYGRPWFLAAVTFVCTILFIIATGWVTAVAYKHFNQPPALERVG